MFYFKVNSNSHINKFVGWARLRSQEAEQQVPNLVLLSLGAHTEHFDFDGNILDTETGKKLT